MNSRLFLFLSLLFGLVCAPAFSQTNHKCDILSFNVGDCYGKIYQPWQYLSIILPKEMDLTKVSPTIRISEGASVSPASGEEVDLTKPTIYTVTAANGEKRIYRINVYTVAKDNPILMSFAFAELPIPQVELESAIEVVFLAKKEPTSVLFFIPKDDNSNIKNLKPTIAIPRGFTIFPKSGVPQDFSNAVKYTLKNNKGVKKVYKVSVYQTNGDNSSTEIKHVEKEKLTVDEPIMAHMHEDFALLEATVMLNKMDAQTPAPYEIFDCKMHEGRILEINMPNYLPNGSYYLDIYSIDDRHERYKNPIEIINHNVISISSTNKSEYILGVDTMEIYGTGFSHETEMVELLSGSNLKFIDHDGNSYPLDALSNQEGTKLTVNKIGNKIPPGEHYIIVQNIKGEGRYKHKIRFRESSKDAPIIEHISNLNPCWGEIVTIKGKQFDNDTFVELVADTTYMGKSAFPATVLSVENNEITLKIEPVYVSKYDEGKAISNFFDIKFRLRLRSNGRQVEYPEKIQISNCEPIIQSIEKNWGQIEPGSFLDIKGKYINAIELKAFIGDKPCSLLQPLLGDPMGYPKVRIPYGIESGKEYIVRFEFKDKVYECPIFVNKPSK